MTKFSDSAISEFTVFKAPNGSLLSRQNAEKLAAKFNFELVDESFPLNESQAVFQYEEHQLALNLLLDKKVNQLSFDFTQGEVGFRAARVSKSNEVVARALGFKPYYRPSVLDATAGMGRDAFIMALLGCNVTMQERNLAIYILLENALTRLNCLQEFSEISQRLSVFNKNSVNGNNWQDAADVIYLDPMFPARKKSALVKKEMRLFKLLAGEDEDADRLLENALQSGVKRVVVKRPKGAPALMNKSPTHEIVAKKFRYDVYLLS